MTDTTDTATATEPTESDAENITQLGLSQMFGQSDNEAESTATDESPVTEEEEVLSQFDNEETDSNEEEEQVPKSVQKLVKQVGKLTARAKDAEEKLEALQQKKLASGDTGPQQLEDINNYEELEEYKKTAMRARKFAMSNIGKDYVEHNGEEYDSEKIASLLEEADEALQTHIPAREQHMIQKAQVEQSMPAHFDWLGNEDSQLHEFFEIGRGLPELKKLHTMPQGEFLFGLLAEGWNAIQSKANALKKASPSKEKKPEPPSPVGNNSAPPKQTKKDRNQLLGDGNINIKSFSNFLNTENKD